MATDPLDVELLRCRDAAMTERFLDALRQCARRYVRRRSDVEQIARDALAELLAKLDDGARPESIDQWIATAASNATRRRFRSTRPYEPFMSTVHSPQIVATPSDLHRQREQLRMVDRSLGKMPDVARVGVLARAEGRRHESIATELSVSAETVRKAVSRARKQLRRELTAQEKLDLLRELAREARRRREAEQGQPTPPKFSRSRDRSEDSSSASR